MSFLPFFTSLFEVLIIAIIINYFLYFFWNTKSMDLIFGLFAFLMLFALSSWFRLPVLHNIMVLLGSVSLIAIIIIFQPELRLALSKLSLKGKGSREITEFDKFLDSLSTSIYRLAEKKTGALIAIENEDSLQEYANKAVSLNADFSPELLETLFATNTPLHDGAVILRGRALLAAGAILPLAEDDIQLAKSMGTRHRAGLGLSRETDAVILIISEETGKVSIARDGIMTRGIKIDRFKGIMRTIFNPPTSSSFQQKFFLREWLKK